MTGRLIHPRQWRRGATLFLTLLLLALVSLFLGQQALRSSTTRLTHLADGFNLQAQWAAEGVAHQWLQQSQNPKVSWDELLEASHWKLGELTVDVRPSSAEQKLQVQKIKPDRWMSLWRQQPSDIILAERPQEALTESSFTALECLLDSRHLGSRAAYVAKSDQVAPADLLTVWGEGKVDINHAPRDILITALTGFTDAQVDGILRLRREAPLNSLDKLTRELSLSADQSESLLQMATFSPRYLQILVELHQGRLQALYHVVVDSQPPGHVLEVRAIQ